MNKCMLVVTLMILGAAGVFGISAEFSTYALLKELDVPEYDEWRLNLNIDTYTWENFGWGTSAATPQETNWHETVYSVSLEWGFWTFPIGDLSLGVELPYYFWYSANDLREYNENNSHTEKFTGFLDPEVFADFKIRVTDHISGLVHVGMTVPGLFEKAVDGGAAIGVTRLTAMGGVIIKYNRFVTRIMLGVESGSTPSVETANHTPALIVPQVAAWDNKNVAVLDLDTIFCAAATTGFGVQYLYKGTYFKGGTWDTASANLTSEPDPLGMLVLKMYFSDTTGGFASSESGTIMTVGIGMGGIGADQDLNPDILYQLTVSKYF